MPLSLTDLIVVDGVKERLDIEGSKSRPPKARTQQPHVTQSSRRRKGMVVRMTYFVNIEICFLAGPAFLPSEHDELPPGVAFMVRFSLFSHPGIRPLTCAVQKSLSGHSGPITALDFSEPYGTLVTASQEDFAPKVWDLLTGEEVGQLKGHRSTVKCIQVEDHVCLTGGEDGNVRLWDLRRVDEDDDWDKESGMVSLSEIAEEEVVDEFGGRSKSSTNGAIKQGGSEAEGSTDREGPCVRLLEGHSKAVSALYFEDDCLVSNQPVLCAVK